MPATARPSTTSNSLPVRQVGAPPPAANNRTAPAAANAPAGQKPRRRTTQAPVKKTVAPPPKVLNREKGAFPIAFFGAAVKPRR